MHGVARQCARIAAANEDPRRFARRNLVASRHGQLHVLREVREVGDRLLHRMHPETLDGEVAVGVRVTEEAMLKHDS